MCYIQIQIHFCVLFDSMHFMTKLDRHYSEVKFYGGKCKSLATCVAFTFFAFCIMLLIRWMWFGRMASFNFMQFKQAVDRKQKKKSHWEISGDQWP